MNKFCLNNQNNDYLLQINKHKNVHRTSSFIYWDYAIIFMARCYWVAHFLQFQTFAPTLLTLGHLVSH